jgi:hypothetical protein
MRRLDVRECAWCKKQFTPIRIDQRFDCRECLEKHFIVERRQALAHWRQMQRTASFFSSALQPAADETDERNTVRRRA